MPPVPADASAMARSAIARDAVAIDVLHREDVHARRADAILLALVEIPDADEHGVLGQHRRRRADRRELRRFLPEQRRERHAVHVAAGRRLGRVHVAVRVDPDEAQRIAEMRATQSALAATDPAARL